MGLKTKTMIAQEVMQSDEFYDLDMGERDLYTQLNLSADQFGIVAGAKKTMRMSGHSEEELEALQPEFVIPVTPDGKLLAIVHWWVMNSKNSRDSKSEYGDLITSNLCFVGESRKYVPRNEADETAAWTGEKAMQYVPVYTSKESQGDPKGNPRESQGQRNIREGKVIQGRESISNESKGIKGSPPATEPMGKRPECPECHGEALKTFSNGRTILICGNCGSFQIDPDTGTFERIS